MSSADRRNMKEKLPHRYARTFTRRELEQGRHLRKALRAPKQKMHGKWSMSLRPLRKESARLLDSHNGYSRARWFRRLAQLLCEQVGARPAKFVPATTVFFVTLVNREDLIKDDGGDEFGLTRDRLDGLKRRFGRMLFGLSYVGMLDVTLYVSARTALRVPRAILPHGHFLVWGCEYEMIDDICRRINAETRPLLPYASAADWRPVTDLLQVIWYIGKMPRKQYQLWRRKSGKSFKQFNRPINGANAVRLYDAMLNIKLPELTMAGVQGIALLEELRKIVSDEATEKQR
jgi:hypothetical protein